MLLGSEKLSRPVGNWLPAVAMVLALAGFVAFHFVYVLRRLELWPWALGLLIACCAVAQALTHVYRRGGVGHQRSLRRRVRVDGPSLTGVLRPVPGDPLAHTPPIAAQRPRKDQPAYRVLSARTFDLELDDGRRVRVEPFVAILDAPDDTILYGTRVELSGPSFSPPSYRDPETVLRGTEEEPVVIRVRPEL